MVEMTGYAGRCGIMEAGKNHEGPAVAPRRASLKPFEPVNRDREFTE